MKRNEPESSSFPLVPPSLEEPNENIDNTGQSPVKNPKTQNLQSGLPSGPNIMYRLQMGTNNKASPVREIPNGASDRYPVSPFPFLPG